MKRRKCYWIFFFFVFGLLSKQEIYAQEYPFSIPYKEIEEVLEEIGVQEKIGGFEEVVKKLLQGEYSLKNIWTAFKQMGWSTWKEDTKHIVRIFAIAVVAAIFTNFTQSLKQGQAAETGFFISYMLITSALLSVFGASKTIAELVLGQVLDFMKVLLPSYCIGIAFTNGSVSAATFYQGSLFAVMVAEWIMEQCILPICHLYFLISVMNHMMKEDFLSKLSDLLYQVASFLMKTTIACVVGIGTIQGMLAPAVDSLQRSVLLKTAGSLPGVGNLLTGVTQTVLSAGILLRNTIGVAGAIFVIGICILPLFRLFLLAVSYHMGVALLQPVSDKRILACFTVAGKAHMLLLQIVFYTALLFLLTILLIASALGMH